MDRFKKAAALLRESPPNQRIDDTQVNVLQAGAGSISLGYKKFGYGERLARLELNEMLLRLGATPILHGSALSPTRKDWLESKRTFLRLLKNCETVYRDPTRPPDSIQNTECGIRK